MNNFISIIVPVYNEEETIGYVLEELLRLKRSMSCPVEIIVIDDGSTDKTGRILLQYPSVKYLRHEENGGKGLAIRTGMKTAMGDIIVIQDADMEYSPAEIPQLIQPLLTGEADVIYGSRFRGKVDGMSRSHYIGNKILSTFAKLLYRVQITDIMTGHKAFTREVLDSLELTENGFNIEVEMTSKLLQGGWRLQEIPITYSYRKAGVSKIGVIDGFRSLWKLFALKF